MNDQRLQEILSNEKFFLKVLELETDEQLREAVRQQGIILSESDTIHLRNALLNLEDSGDWLSDEELEHVAGGAGRTAALNQLEGLFRILCG